MGESVLVSQKLTVIAAIAFALVVCLGTAGQTLTVTDASAQAERPNCENFLEQVDAQAVFDADPSDPFGLDSSGEGNGDACQDSEDEFGTASPVNCDDFREHPDITNSLYDHTIETYGTDKYDLVSCTGSSPVLEPPVGGEPSQPMTETVTIAQPSMHPYVTYMLAGGVPIGVHAFGLVTQGQAATAGGDGVSTAAPQTADDGSNNERRNDRNKAKQNKKNKDKKQPGKQKSKK